MADIQKVLVSTIDAASMASTGLIHIVNNFSQELGPKSKKKLTELSEKFRDVALELATMDYKK